MRTLFRALPLVALLGCGFLLPAALAGEPVVKAKAKLVFENREKFTDVAVGGGTDQTGADIVFRELDRHLAGLARRYLAPGETLVVTMQDIDLAGAIEPWRGPDFGKIRYLRDTQPPRLVFTYQVLDASEKITREGTEKLTNLTFKYQSANVDSDLTRFEKQMLSDWASDVLRKTTKPKK